MSNTHHTRTSYPAESEPPADLLSRLDDMETRGGYRAELEYETRSRIAWMIDIRPVIGNLIALVLLIGAIVVYRMDLGLFPDLGKWSIYVQYLLAGLAGFQLLKASLRSYLPPFVAAAFAAVGFVAAGEGTAFLTLPREFFQWTALLAVIGVACAALSGRD